MSKLSKLMRDPVKFFEDAVHKRIGVKPPKPTNIPTWFQPEIGPELEQILKGDLPVFLYVPWIAEHGDELISRITDEQQYRLAPLDFVKGVDDNTVRRNVLRFARTSPHIYRRMLLRRLIPLRNRVRGVIFSFDWAPIMRIIASVCEELEIPRILVPHESVFIDRHQYYLDKTAFSSVPVADVVLGWGNLQRDIFTERGYPASRFITVGPPKFDSYKDYRPQLTRAQFCQVFGLDPARKTILFASQTLDSQVDTVMARAAQCQVITDLLDTAEAKGMQLIVRLPPSRDNIIAAALDERMQLSPHAAIDDAQCYLVSPEEALYHADLVTSINSTMLFEGLLMGRPAFSAKYISFDSIWQQAGIPAVHNREELVTQIEKMVLDGTWERSAEGFAWAANMFSCGVFDGGASTRIRTFLTEVVTGQRTIPLRPKALTRLLDPQDGDDQLDVVGLPSDDYLLKGTQKYLPQLLKARRAIDSTNGLKDVAALASADLFFQWGKRGILAGLGKDLQLQVSLALGRPTLILEDGFIRSVGIGLSGEPGLSIILDDTTAFYDATRPSRLHRLLQDGPELTPEQTVRARLAIDKIVATKVSKYNAAPDFALGAGTPGKKKVLLVDQRLGDQSVTSGLADEFSFKRMLQDAIRLHPDCDILIKKHPDAITGGKESYYNEERLVSVKGMKNVFPVMVDINPYALLADVDEVYVVSSHLGFEALLAGKKVHCYGAPFYAGWGLTDDEIPVPGRTRKRRLEDIFHFAYIASSRYFHPELDRVVEVEELIDYVREQRDLRLGTA